MKCRICDTRKPRRFCPGVRGDICPQCCGTEREVTIDCPLDCEYLLESRRREKPEPIDQKAIPNQDIRVSDKFVEKQDRLIGHLAQELLRGALDTPGANDHDVREAVGAMIRTYRTRESGLIYETRPANTIAAALYDKLAQGVEDGQKLLAEAAGASVLRDADVLGSLVFLQRVAHHYPSKRPKSRAFLSFLYDAYGAVVDGGEVPPPGPVSPLIL